MIRKWLRLLHRYIGALAAAILLVLAVTGGALIFKDELLRLQYPSLSIPLPKLSVEDHANALRSIHVHYGAQLLMVRMPVEGVPAYRVFLDGREAIVSLGTFEIIDEWRWNESLTGILFEVHYRLLAGQPGKIVVGVLGILLSLMALSGMYLWWGVRRQFRGSSLKLKTMSRPGLIRFHRDSGAITAVLLVLFGLTGAGVVFGDSTRAVLNYLLSPGAESSTRPVVRANADVPTPSHTILRLVQDELAEGDLMSWSPPKASSAVHHFRFRMPGEPHPYGRSSVLVDGLSGTILATEDATQVSRGDRVANWMFPLHSARIGGPLYRIISFLAAIALAAISLTGLIAFVKGFKPAKRAERKSGS